MKQKQIDSNKKISLKNIIILQLIVVIYSLSGVFGKVASSNEFLSMRFIFFYGLEIAFLGIYALLWQQIIKRMDLSIAYANRAMSLLWSMLWAISFFNENVTVQNIFGVTIVLAGTIIVNGDFDE